MSAQRNIQIGTYKGENAPNIRLIEEAFEIPQLDKTRRIWALLPHDYDQSER